MPKIVTFRHKGNFSKLDTYFGKAKKALRLSILDKYGRKGVEALKNATPVNTGFTANSWKYEIRRDDRGATIEFSNTNRNQGILVVVLLIYGHGTGTGGYVRGIDFVNPALQPVFEELADSAWKEVTAL